jgi:hypothetical protein
VAERDDELGDCAAGSLGQDIADEGAIDLQFVEGQTPEVSEGRVSGAEIVQGEFWR